MIDGMEPLNEFHRSQDSNAHHWHYDHSGSHHSDIHNHHHNNNQCCPIFHLKRPHLRNLVFLLQKMALVSFHTQSLKQKKADTSKEDIAENKMVYSHDDVM